MPWGCYSWLCNFSGNQLMIFEVDGDVDGWFLVVKWWWLVFLITGDVDNKIELM